MWLNLNFLLVTIIWTVLMKKSESYNMDPITHSPIIESTPISSWEIVREFLTRHSPNLQVMSGKTSLEDIADLCEAVERDENTATELYDKKLYYYVPVTPANENNLPTFTVPCYGWKRQACVGIPKPPFDYRCSFWTPFFHNGGDNCEDKGTIGYRVKRIARPFESMTVSGPEAVALCATAKLLETGFSESSGKAEVKAIALPTNEASTLRCINWMLSPEGGWIKEQLNKTECKVINENRPGPYIDNEINFDKDVIENVFADVVKCESIGQKINCIFSHKFGIKY